MGIGVLIERFEIGNEDIDEPSSRLGVVSQKIITPRQRILINGVHSVVLPPPLFEFQWKGGEVLPRRDADCFFREDQRHTSYCRHKNHRTCQGWSSGSGK